MNKKEAGSLGGRKTVEKYGREYMSEIGKKGYKVTTSRYQVLPGRLNQWVMVHRDTGIIKAVWH